MELDISENTLEGKVWNSGLGTLADFFVIQKQKPVSPGGNSLLLVFCLIIICLLAIVVIILIFGRKKDQAAQLTKASDKEVIVESLDDKSQVHTLWNFKKVKFFLFSRIWLFLVTFNF